MAIPYKALVGGGISLGLAGGTGAILINHFNSEENNLENKLKKVGYSVLNTESNDEWQEVLTAYNQITEPADIFEANPNKNKNKDYLKGKCRVILKKEFKVSKDYELAKRWCVKEETIEKMLTSNGYTKIGSEDNQDNNAKWQNKLNLLKAAPKSDSKITVNLTNNNSNDLAALKQACVSLNIGTAKTHASKDFETKFMQAREWCAVKNPNK